jgi:Glycosyl hydrolase family 47
VSDVLAWAILRTGQALRGAAAPSAPHAHADAPSCAGDGRWTRRDAGIGAGADSYYEYLLKTYLAFGDESYLHMFAEQYAAAAAAMHLAPEERGLGWMYDVHMHSGGAVNRWLSSLSAFWPGLQARARRTAAHRL